MAQSPCKAVYMPPGGRSSSSTLQPDIAARSLTALRAHMLALASISPDLPPDHKTQVVPATPSCWRCRTALMAEHISARTYGGEPAGPPSTPARRPTTCRRVARRHVESLSELTGAGSGAALHHLVMVLEHAGRPQRGMSWSVAYPTPNRDPLSNSHDTRTLDDGNLVRPRSSLLQDLGLRRACELHTSASTKPASVRWSGGKWRLCATASGTLCAVAASCRLRSMRTSTCTPPVRRNGSPTIMTVDLLIATVPTRDHEESPSHMQATDGRCLPCRTWQPGILSVFFADRAATMQALGWTHLHLRTRAQTPRCSAGAAPCPRYHAEPRLTCHTKPEMRARCCMTPRGVRAPCCHILNQLVSDTCIAYGYGVAHAVNMSAVTLP